MKQTVLYAAGKSYSVKEILDHIRYVEGAAHTAKEPTTDEAKVLAAIQQTFTMIGYQALTQLVPAMGRVVLKGLASVQEAVKRELAAVE